MTMPTALIEGPFRRSPRMRSAMADIDPTKREQGDDNETHHPRGRLPTIVVGAVIGMLLWLLLDHMIPP